MDPLYFATPAAFREWLRVRGASDSELLVGFYKVGSGRPSITWPEAVDEALCAGWIDGVRRRVDDEAYTIRFTPRRTRSVWSAVNIARVAELTRVGRMQPAGLAAFERRQDARSGIYAYEQPQPAALDDAAVRQFKKAPAAWKFFQAQPASYRRTATYWAVSAKKADTRARRLATLITDSAAGRRIKQLTPSPPPV